MCSHKCSDGSEKGNIENSTGSHSNEPKQQSHIKPDPPISFSIPKSSDPPKSFDTPKYESPKTFVSPELFEIPKTSGFSEPSEVSQFKELVYADRIGQDRYDSKVDVTEYEEEEVGVRKKSISQKNENHLLRQRQIQEYSWIVSREARDKRIMIRQGKLPEESPNKRKRVVFDDCIDLYPDG